MYNQYKSLQLLTGRFPEAKPSFIVKVQLLTTRRQDLFAICLLDSMVRINCTKTKRSSDRYRIPSSSISVRSTPDGVSLLRNKRPVTEHIALDSVLNLSVSYMVHYHGTDFMW